jgi:two-component system, OmpR family, alkaline phosphatase synthesis response regulator PhoP
MQASTNRSVPTIADSTATKKILLVEDSDTTRLTHRIMITKRTGYNVVSVANGVEALRMVALENPDLILMDVVMPGMDGLEVCRRLRKDAATAEVPIVLLTFRVGEESVAEGYANGCTAYLKKPISVDELVNVLRQHLGG